MRNVALFAPPVAHPGDGGAGGPERDRTADLLTARRSNAGTGEETGATGPNSSTDHPEAPGPVTEKPAPVTNGDPVEVALATALERASAAGAWDVVGTLAAELEARRKARTEADNVVAIDRARRKR